MKHIWKVWERDVIEVNGYVSRAHWSLESTDGEHSVTANGTVDFTGKATIPLEIITEQLLVVWVKQSLGDYCKFVEERNERAIQNKK